MNGTKPKFLKKSALNPEYFKKPNPYMNAPSCHVNLLELSRYAKKHRKKLIDLTQDEIKKFSIQQEITKKGTDLPGSFFYHLYILYPSRYTDDT